MNFFFKLVNCVYPIAHLNYLKKKSASSKHNFQCYSPHFNALLPSYVWLQYFRIWQVWQPPTSLNGDWMMEKLDKQN